MKAQHGGCPPRMIGCRMDCGHRAMVEDYRAARERDEQKRDEECIGYEADEALYTGPMVNFRSWLESLAGQGIYSKEEPE